MLEASEEAYLRDDIPCGSEACSTCSNGLPALSADASHYVIPDSQALDGYLEVFELPQLRNFVLLSSVLEKVWPSLRTHDHTELLGPSVSPVYYGALNARVP